MVTGADPGRDHPSVDPDPAGSGGGRDRITYTLLMVYAVPMAAVFTISTTTIASRLSVYLLIATFRHVESPRHG